MTVALAYQTNHWSYLNLSRNPAIAPQWETSTQHFIQFYTFVLVVSTWLIWWHNTSHIKTKSMWNSPSSYLWYHKQTCCEKTNNPQWEGLQSSLLHPPLWRNVEVNIFWNRKANNELLCRMRRTAQQADYWQRPRSSRAQLQFVERETTTFMLKTNETRWTRIHYLLSCCLDK